MKVRWLGWAGVEVEAEGAAVVIDPLDDPGAMFAALGDGAPRGCSCRRCVAPDARRSRGRRAGQPSASRPHRRWSARRCPGGPDAAVHEPAWPGGDGRRTSPWRRLTRELETAGARRQGDARSGRGSRSGRSAITALPAVDGLGDPQVSWLVEAEGQRVLHLGDTIFHGYWWRMARRHGPFDLVFAPINGAGGRLPSPAAAEPTRRGDGARAGGPRRRVTRGAARSFRCTTTASGSIRGTGRSTTRWSASTSPSARVPTSPGRWNPARAWRSRPPRPSGRSPRRRRGTRGPPAWRRPGSGSRWCPECGG